MNKNDVLKQAEKEVQEELFREAVEYQKDKLRAIKWWHKYIPYKIVLIRR